MKINANNNTSDLFFEVHKDQFGINSDDVPVFFLTFFWELVTGMKHTHFLSKEKINIINGDSENLISYPRVFFVDESELTHNTESIESTEGSAVKLDVLLKRFIRIKNPAEGLRTLIKGDDFREKKQSFFREILESLSPHNRRLLLQIIEDLKERKNLEAIYPLSKKDEDMGTPDPKETEKLGEILAILTKALNEGKTSKENPFLRNDGLEESVSVENLCGKRDISRESLYEEEINFSTLKKEKVSPTEKILTVLLKEKRNEEKMEAFISPQRIEKISLTPKGCPSVEEMIYDSNWQGKLPPERQDKEIQMETGKTFEETFPNKVASSDEELGQKMQAHSPQEKPDVGLNTSFGGEENQKEIKLKGRYSLEEKIYDTNQRNKELQMETGKTFEETFPNKVASSDEELGQKMQAHSPQEKPVEEVRLRKKVMTDAVKIKRNESENPSATVSHIKETEKERWQLSLREGRAFPVRMEEIADFVHEIVFKLRPHGKYEAKVKLHPPELGELQLTIQVDKNEVKLVFTVEHPRAAETLQQQLHRLDLAFQNLGLELGETQINLADQGQYSFLDHREKSSISKSSSKKKLRPIEEKIQSKRALSKNLIDILV